MARKPDINLGVFGIEPDPPEPPIRYYNPTIVIEKTRKPISLGIKLVEGEVGRPSKLTEERAAIIVDKIRNGSPDVVAAGCVGIDDTTFWRWIRQGKKDALEGVESNYARFALAVAIAEKEHQDEIARKWIKITTEPTTKRKTVYKGQLVPDPQTGELREVKVLESDTIEQTGDGNWQGIAEFAARRYPEHWRKKDSIEMSGPNGGPIEVQTIDPEKMSPQAREVLLQEAKRILAEAAKKTTNTEAEIETKIETQTEIETDTEE